jgi:cytochrome c oxidase cbb3-type subunit I/II
MPAYAFLASSNVDYSRTSAKLSAMKAVGVPYTDGQVQSAEAEAKRDAALVAKELRDNGAEVAAESEMVALIAYLQHLGNPSRAPTPGAPVAKKGGE